MNFVRKSFLINFRSLKHLSTSTGTQELLNIRHIAGVNKFIKYKEKSKLLIKNPSEYLANLSRASLANSDSIIFSEDIKNIVTLAENDKDIQLLEKVLLKFSSQKNVVQYNPFSFGPQIMRLLYIKNKPQKALELVQNPNFSQYFRHGVTALLLLDLLFINNMYQNVIEMYECLRKSTDRKYGDNIKLYFFAACYKANTPECVEKAKAVWCSEMQGNKTILRIRLLFSVLLLNHNECPSDVLTSYYNPSGAFLSLKENIKVRNVLAMENIASNRSVILIQNINKWNSFQYMVLAKGNRFWDAFKGLEDILNSENVNRFVMSQEALSFIEKEVQGSSEDNVVRFHKIKQEIMNRNLITYEPLDTFLFGDMSMGKNRLTGLEKEDEVVEQSDIFHSQKMHARSNIFTQAQT